MKLWLKRIFLSAISLLFVFGTFLLDEKVTTARDDSEVSLISVVEKGADAVMETSGDGSYRFESGQTQPMTIVLSENAVLRFAPKTSATLTLGKAGFVEREATFTFNNGRIWINSIASSLLLEVKTSGVQFKMTPGIFDLKYSDRLVDATAYRHSVTAEFLGNQLVLPEGRNMTLDEAKIQNSASTIAKLRYSKLLKEFPYFSPEKPDDWVLQNQSQDEAFFAAYEQKRNRALRDEGPHFGSDENSLFSRLSEFLKQSSITLTFDPQKKEKREMALVFSYFDGAVYHTLVGNNPQSNTLLLSFQKHAQPLRENPQFQVELQNRIDAFAFSRPDDHFFEAKTTLRDLSVSSPLNRFRLAFLDVSDAQALGSDTETRARVFQLLRIFGTLLDGSLKRVNSPESADELFVQYISYQDFLRQHPELLREEFMKISELYERAHLNLLGTKEAADDERQYFISEKLKSIAMIRGFMEKEVLPFQEGRRSILSLANQIESLKPAFSDTAVASYFDNQLTTLQPFLAFLRSSRAESLHGSFEKDFTEFSANLDDLRKVTQLLGAATGGTQISAFRREELAGMVADDFSGINISNIKIILPEGEDDPRVKIVSAEFEGKTFSATYDTARKVMSELVFDSEKVPNAVRLENLSKFFLFKMGKFVLPTGATPDSLTEAPSQESLLEKVSKATLLEQLKKLNISVEEKYLGLENLKDGVVHVRLALMGEGVDAKVFSFDVSENASVASNLKVQTVSGEIPVNDTFGLRELPTKVEQIYQRAVFEKQKEEELKKFADNPAE